METRDYVGSLEYVDGEVDFIHFANGYVRLSHDVEEVVNRTEIEPSGAVQGVQINSDAIVPLVTTPTYSK